MIWRHKSSTQVNSIAAWRVSTFVHRPKYGVRSGKLTEASCFVFIISSFWNENSAFYHGDLQNILVKVGHVQKYRLLSSICIRVEWAKLIFLMILIILSLSETIHRMAPRSLSQLFSIQTRNLQRPPVNTSQVSWEKLCSGIEKLFCWPLLPKKGACGEFDRLLTSFLLVRVLMTDFHLIYNASPNLWCLFFRS